MILNTVNFPIGNCLFVDALFGNDAAAQLESPALPYATLTAAKTAAASGQIIFVYPGTYNERNLLKDGVHWHFYAGAKVIYTGNADGAIWDNTINYGVNAPVFSRITGEGQFIRSAGLANGNAISAINIQNASSDIYIEGDTAQCNTTNTAGTDAVIKHDGGTFRFKFNSITTTTATGVWWSNGDMYGSVNELSAGSSILAYGAFYSSPGTLSASDNNGSDTYVSGYAWLKADRIDGGSNTAIRVDGATGTAARVWVDVTEAVSASTGALNNALAVITINGARVYVKVDKISAPSDQACASCDNDAQFWLNAQKLSCGKYGLLLNNGTAWVNGLKIEDTNNAAADLVRCVGGTHFVSFMSSITGTLANGIRHNGGAMTFSAGTVDSSASSNTKFPVLLASNGLILDNVTLIANSGAADVISAASSNFTVTCNGVRDPGNLGVNASHVTVAHDPIL